MLDPPPDLFSLAADLIEVHEARYGLEQAYNLLLCAFGLREREGNPTEEDEKTHQVLLALDQHLWEDAQRRWRGIIADLRGDVLTKEVH